MKMALIVTSVVVVLGLLLSAPVPWVSARVRGADASDGGKQADNTLLFFILMFSASLVGLVILFKR